MAALPALVAMLGLAGVCGADDDEPVLPPAQELTPDRDTLAGRLGVLVRRFRFEGNSVFTDEQLAEAIKEYVGRKLTSEQLHQARRALTLHYVDRGYINSGAVLPDQKVEDGIITFRIVEGELSEITVTGNERTKTEYIRQRVARGIEPPLNMVRLRDNLEILRQGPLFDRVQAELRPGTGAGQSRLELNVKERDPFRAALEFANDQNPGTGAERFRLLLWHRNLTGVGDALELKYGLTTRGLEDIEFACLDDVAAAYTLPLNRHDTTLRLGYERSDSLLIEPPFQDLDITSETQSFSVGVRHPFHRTPNTEFAMSLTAQRRSNQTELLGQPFSFEPGADDGETDVAVLRFAQEWTTRDERRVLAARSTFSFGLPVLGATEHADLPDGQFVAWLGQFQHVQRLWETDARLITRLSTQLASDSLLSLEQFGLGGLETVRGYRENQLVRDNALVGSAELRLPLLRDPGTHTDVLQLAPFFDIGYGWDTRTPHWDQLICSAGLGLLLHLDDRLDARVYWGMPFRKCDQADHNLQDAGIHFRLLLRLY